MPLRRREFADGSGYECTSSRLSPYTSFFSTLCRRDEELDWFELHITCVAAVASLIISVVNGERWWKRMIGAPRLFLHNLRSKASTTCKQMNEQWRVHHGTRRSITSWKCAGVFENVNRQKEQVRCLDEGVVQTTACCKRLRPTAAGSKQMGCQLSAKNEWSLESTRQLGCNMDWQRRLCWSVDCCCGTTETEIVSFNSTALSSRTQVGSIILRPSQSSW